MAILTTYKRVADPFQVREHNGLQFNYGVGVVRNDNVISKVEEGFTVLVDDNINYIEVSDTGIVSSNIVGYSKGQIPLYAATTLNGLITEVIDDRSFFNIGGGGGGDDSFGFIKIPVEITSFDVI